MGDAGRRAVSARVGGYAPDAAADDAAADDGDDVAGGDAARYASRDAGGVQGSPGGDAVYRPSLDFLTASSHTSTPVETQFSGDDLLSLHDMGIDLGEDDTPVPATRAAPKKKTRGKGKGKAVGESSQPAAPGRRKWTEDEYAGVARGWLEVCEQPADRQHVGEDQSCL